MVKGNKKQKSLAKPIREFVFYAFVFSIPFQLIPIGLKGITLSQIVGVGLLCAAIFRPRICFRSPPLALKLFGVYLIGFLIFGLLYENKFFREVIIAFITMSQLLLMFWVSHSLMLDEVIRKKTILLLSISCVLLSAFLILGIGIEEVAQGRYTLFGQNANALSGTLAIGFLCLLGYRYGRLEPRSAIQIFTWIGLGILLIAMLKTGSRGGLVALIGGVLAFLVKGKTLQGKIKMMAMVLVGLALIVVVVFENEAIRSRFEAAIYEGSFAGREEILPKAWEMFLERPLLGWGRVNHYHELGSRLGLQTRDPHNLYLYLLNEGGIVGALPFFAGLFLCGLGAWKARRGRSGVIPVALFGAIFLISLKGTTHMDKLFWVVMAYTTASSYTSGRQAMIVGQHAREVGEKLDFVTTTETTISQKT